MRARISTLAVTCALMAAVSAPLAAQEEERVYTRVALWDVERSRWGDFTEWFETYTQPIMERLFAEGVIDEWGMDAASIHRPDDYSHGTWFSATSVANLERVLDEFEAQFEAMDEEDSRAALGDLAGMLIKHRDYLDRDLVRRATDAELDGGYWYGWTVQVEPGQGSEFRSYWDEHTQPILERLLAEGTIVAYGLSVEDLITQGFGLRIGWYYARDMESLERAWASFREYTAGMSEEARRGRFAALRENVERGTFREYLTELTHFAIRAH